MLNLHALKNKEWAYFTIFPVDKPKLSAANNNAVDNGTRYIVMLHSCWFGGAVMQIGMHVFLEEK